MYNTFKAVSLSYKKAPIKVRELIALDQQSCVRFLGQAKDFLDTQDVLVLSTCNRTEVYYTSSEDQSEDIIKLIGIQKGIENILQYKPYFEIINEHQEAVAHLFDVSMGLEAQVVGDMHIINQVKNAYQLTANEDLAGPFLHRLLHAIFFTNKKVTQETSFRDGAASVPYATVELVETLTASIHQPKVLLIGLGEMGTDIASYFATRREFQVSVSNRTLDKSIDISNEHAFKIVPFEKLSSSLHEFDVVISTVLAPQPIITAKTIEHEQRGQYRFFIDLSVPRSIDSDVETIEGNQLYNVDQIQVKASEALQKRMASIPQVKEIIRESVEEFNVWARELELSPVIQRFKNTLEQIRREEVSRHLKQLTEKESETVDMITKNIMQKIIKLPVLQLKAACQRGEAETLIDVLNDLFNLEKEDHKEIK